MIAVIWLLQWENNSRLIHELPSESDHRPDRESQVAIPAIKWLLQTVRIYFSPKGFLKSLRSWQVRVAETLCACIREVLGSILS
jgi:hypothetical protein